MLQIGRYSYRGTGAVMVAGPLGVALVPPEWAKGAREALIGRAEIVAWLTQVSQAGADAAVLDLAGPQAHLSLLGRAWVRALAPGLAEAQEWQAPVWGWALNPGDWECLDVELGVAEAERTVGEWRLATEDLVDARSLRIGRALREETDRFERPFELPQAGASGEALGASRLAEYRDGEPGIPVRSRRAARARAGEPGGPGAQGGDEVVWSAADGESGRESAAAKPRHLWVPPDPTQPSGLRLRTRTRAAGPRHRRVPEVETEEALVEPVAQTPERALRRRGRRVAEPVARTPEQASESAAPLRSPESAASPESTDTPVVGWAGPAGLAAPDAERPGPVEPVAGSADAASPEPAGSAVEPGPGPADDAVEWPEPAEAADDAEAAVGAPWDMAEPDPEPLVEWTPFSPAEPFTNRRTDFFSQGLAASEPPANMSPAAYGGPEDNPELYEATLTPEALARMRQEQSATGDTIMRRVPDAVPTTPSAFLIYAGSAPVEVVRDVIIGRDPNTRVLTGRPMAAPLRVPSPGSEISRSHCAVMATAPGVWSLMDLASVNGSILVHPDGSSEDVPAMVGVPLADGDLIDLGEGVTVEFRVR